MGKLWPVLSLEACMREEVIRLLGHRSAWIPMPALEELLPQVAASFQADVLGNIPFEDLMSGKYELHLKEGPYATGEPDDGIILKHPDKEDPSRIIHGVPPDSKVYLQYRLRTMDMMKAAGCYQTAFDPFFELMEELWEGIDQYLFTFILELTGLRPELGVTGWDRDRSLIRVMQYLDPRGDGSGLAGKFHTDKNDITFHLYDSVPGLVVVAEGEQQELVPTRPGMALAFSSDRFVIPSGLPAVRHGAVDNGKRRVIVMFVHFTYND